MDRWEYLHLQYWSQRQQDDSYTWTVHVRGEPQEGSLEEVLNNLGEQGWELVAHTIPGLRIRKTNPTGPLPLPSQPVGTEARPFHLILKRKREN